MSFKPPNPDEGARPRLRALPFSYIVLILGAVALLLFFFSEELVSIGSSVFSFLSDNYLYLLPVFVGLYFGYRIYLQYIRSGILLQLEDLEGNVTAIDEVSKERFGKMTVINGSLNPYNTHCGKLLYRCKSVDYVTNTIEMGDQHSKDMDPVLLLTYRSRLRDFLRMFKKASVQVTESKLVPHIMAEGIATKIIDKHLALISPVADDAPSEDES